MARRHPLRDEIEREIKEHPGKKAWEIAQASGLVEEKGMDKATEYVRHVRKDLRRKGELKKEKDPDRFASDEDRLADITTLFEIRNGKMSRKAAHTMLLMNCYLRLRSQDDAIHMAAIDHTYQLNSELENPLPLAEAVKICEVALAKYMESIDEEKQAAAIKLGYPGAGLNYTSESLFLKCEIKNDELPLLRTIKRAYNIGD